MPGNCERLPPAPTGKASCAFLSSHVPSRSIRQLPITEKISFNQINRNAGHRIKYTRVVN